MKKLFLVSLLIFTGCAPAEEEDPFQKQSEVLSNVEELVDFQSSSAVAEWTPSMQKKIDEMFCNMGTSMLLDPVNKLY